MTITLDPRKTIRIIAPSGAVDEPQAFARGIERLQQRGFVVQESNTATRQYMRFAGTDEERVAELHEAALDRDCGIVLAARGGYGISRLLSAIDWQRLGAQSKVWCGHSDFTALAMGLIAHGAVKRGTRVLLGPMLVHGFGEQDPCEWALRDCVQAFAEPAHTQFDTTSPDSQITGTMWGGNLSMIESLVGSPYMPQIEGGILFIEDIGETPRKVERMLLTLIHAGVLQRQAAVLWGRFTDYKLYDNDRGYDMPVVKELIARRCPGTVFVDGLPFGHVPDKCTLAVGVPYELSVLAGSARLFELASDHQTARVDHIARLTGLSLQ